MTKKKKKLKSTDRSKQNDISNTKKRDRKIDMNKSMRQSILFPSQLGEKQQPMLSSTIKVLSKESPKLKISHIFEPWIVRDDLD
ncbi:unnamed protein product, partial [Rotaria sp. Silwood1]